jgi:hypothetical protein
MGRNNRREVPDYPRTLQGALSCWSDLSTHRAASQSELPATLTDVSEDRTWEPPGPENNEGSPGGTCGRMVFRYQVGFISEPFASKVDIFKGFFEDTPSHHDVLAVYYMGLSDAEDGQECHVIEFETGMAISDEDIETYELEEIK